MYLTAHMIFRKQHIRNFVEKLSISNKSGVVEFPKRDFLNFLVRKYMYKPNQHYKPIFGRDVVNIVIPENFVEGRREFLVLPKSSWKPLENEFEKLFYLLFFKYETDSSFNKGTRKDRRIEFLKACNIDLATMNEDSFRKSYDRYLKKMQDKLKLQFNNNDFSILEYYKSVC